jgi:hypothetical protein
VLTLKQDGVNQGFIAAHFTNPGPSTVNHVVATISANGGLAPLPLPPTAFTLPAGCTATASGAGSVITCAIGQVQPGSVRRLISFIVPAGTQPLSFSAYISVSFDESKNTQLQDTVTDDDVPAFFVSPGDGTQKGQCIANSGGTLTASTPVQQTFLSYPALSVSSVPCTPGAAGVKAGHPDLTGVNLFGDTAFVEFLDGNGLATVKITIFNPPQGVTKRTLRFVEYANYPDLTPTVGTDGSQFVPLCVKSGGVLQIPVGSGFRSCVVSVDNGPAGSLVGTLLAQGGSDPGYGSAG